MYVVLNMNHGIYLARSAEGNLTTGPRVMPSPNTELLTPPLSCKETKQHTMKMYLKH